MPKKKKEKTYQEWVDKILLALRDELFIWQFNNPAPVEGVVMCEPVVVEGASAEWEFTIKRVPDYSNTVLYEGAATHERSGTVVQLNKELAGQIFIIAYEILNRNSKHVRSKRSDPVRPVVRGEAPS